MNDLIISWFHAMNTSKSIEWLEMYFTCILNLIILRIIFKVLRNSSAGLFLLCILTFDLKHFSTFC